MVHELVGIQNGRVTIDAESRKDLKVGAPECRILHGERKLKIRRPIIGPRIVFLVGSLLRRTALFQFRRSGSRFSFLCPVISVENTSYFKSSINRDARGHATLR